MELDKEAQEALEQNAKILEDLIQNPTLAKLAPVVAYLSSKDQANEQQLIMLNALVSTVIDLLIDKKVLEHDEFSTYLEKIVKELTEEKIKYYTELQASVEEVTSDAE